LTVLQNTEHVWYHLPVMLACICLCSLVARPRFLSSLVLCSGIPIVVLSVFFGMKYQDFGTTSVSFRGYSGVQWMWSVLFLFPQTIVYVVETSWREAFLSRRRANKRLEASEESLARAEAMLKSMLPVHVLHTVEHLSLSNLRKNSVLMLFERCEAFQSDIKDFTMFSSQRTPTEVVKVLSSLFTLFDDQVNLLLLERHQLVGDACVVVEPACDKNHQQMIVVSLLCLIGRVCVDLRSESAIAGIHRR